MAGFGIARSRDVWDRGNGVSSVLVSVIDLTAQAVLH